MCPGVSSVLEVFVPVTNISVSDAALVYYYDYFASLSIITVIDAASEIGV